MDETTQQQIALACVALLEKDAANYSQERECNSRGEPSTKKEAIEWLVNAAGEPDITLENVTDALWIIYKRSRSGSQTRQWVTRLLFDLLQREGNTARDAIELAATLYNLSPRDSQEQQAAVQALLDLAKRRDIPFGDAVEAAHSLYVQAVYAQGPRGSKERQLASEVLLAQARWPETTAAQAQEAALALCYAAPYRSQERNQSILALIEVTKRPDLSFEDAVVLDYERATQGGTRALHRQQLAAKKQMWETVAQRPDLTTEQRAEVVRAIEDYSEFLK